jgi:Pentapeptide repeats (8 copies)
MCSQHCFTSPLTGEVGAKRRVGVTRSCSEAGARTVRRALYLLLLLGLATPAHAGCADAPAPKVNWFRCNFNHIDMEGVDLSGANLRFATFSSVHFHAANLRNIDARNAKFIDSNLAGARLENANLAAADFTKANLRDANLRGADARRARFFGADLRDADLSAARLDGADLFNADLSGALWVDGLSRCAPGSIGQCHGSSQNLAPRAAPPVSPLGGRSGDEPPGAPDQQRPGAHSADNRGAMR